MNTHNDSKVLIETFIKKLRNYRKKINVLEYVTFITYYNRLKMYAGFYIPYKKLQMKLEYTKPSKKLLETDSQNTSQEMIDNLLWL